MVTITCGACGEKFNTHPAIRDVGVIIISNIVLRCPNCNVNLHAPEFEMTMMPLDGFPEPQPRPKLRLVDA